MSTIAIIINTTKNFPLKHVGFKFELKLQQNSNYFDQQFSIRVIVLGVGENPKYVIYMLNIFPFL